jgi:hypothetical protein
MRPRQKTSVVKMAMACIAVFSLLLSNMDSAAARLDPTSPPPNASRGPLLRATGNRPSKPAQMPSQTMMMPMMFPLFLQNQDFSSTLVLTNAANQNTYADVVLTGTDGKQITQQTVQFTAHSQRTVDIQSLLMSAVSPATTGSITVMQDPQFESTMVILGQLSMTYHASDRESFVDQEISMPNAQGSQTLRAVANSGEGSPLVAISNLSDMPQHIAISCLPENGQSFSKSVALSAGETLLTESCSDRTIHGATIESFPAYENDAPHGPIGISLTTDGMAGTLAAFGLQSQRIGDHHFFSNITFTDPMMLMSSSTVFDGVPVGPPNLLLSGDYVPEISLANFSAKNLQVAVQYAQSSATTPETKQVASLTVPANSSKKIALKDLQGDPQLQDSFLLTSSWRSRRRSRQARFEK